MFRFFFVFVLVPFVVAFIGLTSASMAGGGPLFESFELKPNNLRGDTCNGQTQGGTCAQITSCGSTQLVEEIGFFQAKPGKVRLDFCAESNSECEDFDLKCEVLVDGTQAEPGIVRLGEADNDSRCFTWYASVAGFYKTHMAQFRCRRASCDTCNSINQIDIDQYTASVFFNLL